MNLYKTSVFLFIAAMCAAANAGTEELFRGAAWIEAPAGMNAAVFAATLKARALTLEDGFKNPPRDARPHTWYHMMNGNVTKEGITADFEALAQAGVGGVQMFDAGCAVPPGDISFNTPEWFDVFRHAQKAPFACDITRFVPEGAGSFELEIEVVNRWANRFLGDEILHDNDSEWVLPRNPKDRWAIKVLPQWVKEGRKSPTGRKAFSTWKHYVMTDPMLDSGLLGPVVLRFGRAFPK